MGQGLCCSQVSESTVGIKERWGRFVEVLHPGCHCVCRCFGSRVAGALTMRVQQMDVHCETKTKDNVFVMVVASIQYRVAEEHAKEAFYKLSRPQEQIQAYVFDVVRSSVSRLNLDHVFEQKTKIAKSVEDELEKAMKTYGYKIVQTLIIDIIPDQAVMKAMNEINAAARIRVAAQDKAEADKILQVKCAEAEAQSKFLSGQGVARQRQAIMDGLRESVLGFSHDVPGTTPKDVMDMVMFSQYFDTMRDIGTHVKSSAVFIPHQICSSLLQDDTFTDAACKSKEAAGPRPLRVIDVKATIKNREWGGIYFKRRWGSWHVISHTWSAGIRKFSETVGIKVGTAGGGSSSSCSYEELFETSNFSREKCYQELIEFLEIPRIDGVSWVWFDALCINQTDDKEKEAEIQHMGAFYQESLGCYVAHHGIGMGFKVLDDFSGAGAADAVLSGYIMRNWDAYLPRWFSRVWTLQEWELPKQVTFIVEGLDMERLTMASDENRIHPELPCLDYIELRPIRGQQGRYFATDKAYLSLVELYRSFTKIAVGERIQLYKRMMLKFPRHFNIAAKPEIDAGIDASLVVKEISQRHASHEEDRVLSILKLLGVEAAFQVRTKRSLKEQVIHLAESLVLKQQQEVLLQLCLADGDGNEWQGMSWAPTFNVLQGEISVQGLQRHIIRSWFDSVLDNNWVIQNFESAGARVVEVSDGGCLKLESKVLQGELNISHTQGWGEVGAELTVAGKPLLPLNELDVPHTAERAPHVFGVLAKFSRSEAQGCVVWKGPGLYQKMCKLSPKIRVWLVRMGSAKLMRPAMRRTWRHFTYFLVCIDAMPTSLITDGGGTLLLHKAGYFAFPTGRVISIVNGTTPSTIILGGFGADLSPYIMPSNSGSP